MGQRWIISSDITASAVAHVALLTLLVLFSDVRPFGAVTADEVPVEIVTPQELAEQQTTAEPPPAESKPEPQPDFSRLDKPPADTAPQPSPAASPPAAAPAPVVAPQKQAALAPPRASQPPPSQPAAPAYKPPEPDVSIKYQVLLGLPPDISPMPPPPAQNSGKGDDDFDAPATEAADVASTLIAAFRRHLRTCSKLPASLSNSDDVKVKLRVLMTQDGRLAAEPILIEASASMKGPLLMQGAIRALQACQPYAMLPADRYGEWKVLDLSFTPQEFSAP
jgi:outer membrane biosynthesis protein TonB